MTAAAPTQSRSRHRRTSLQSELLRQRYLLRDASGQLIETPRQMFTRVARTIAAIDRLHGSTEREVKTSAKAFSDMMSQGIFLPNSPTLMNAGRKNGMCSACFVLPVEDSIEGIFNSITLTALIQRSGGGTGFSFDKLRPNGDLVASSGGRTSGPISFMRVFAETTNAIQQGAHRRGANMGMMSLEHPDILKFITAKHQPGAFENFNLTVKIGTRWMDTLLKDPFRAHTVTNPRTGKRYVIPKDIDYELYKLQDLRVAEEPDGSCFTVQEIWNQIVTRAWAGGEPGVCFIDRVNDDNPTPALGRIESLNACGEQPLLPYESCNLGSINIAKFVRAESGDLRWSRLSRTVKLAVRFLDNVVDLSHYPTERLRAAALANRKIGLGIMGFADALVKLGIRYDSHEALSFAAKLGRFIQDYAHDASQELALERGSFPNWIGSTWDRKHGRAMRNASCTTIAPTGSISIIAGCSGGIEPIYSLACRRRALEGQEFLQVHPLIERIGKRDGWLSDSVRGVLLKGTTPTRIPGLPRSVAEVLVTAQDIAVDWHVRMQAVFQEHVDNAVSKTVNLPASASVSDVDRILRLAYRLGCKGITVYRDGSRQGQTLSNPRGSEQDAPRTPTLHTGPNAKSAYADCTHPACDDRLEPVPAVIAKNLCGHSTLAAVDARCPHCVDS